MLVERSNLAVGDTVFYRTYQGEKIPAIIIKRNTPSTPAEYAEHYEIRITGRKSRIYCKGDEFTTSGAWLRKR
jgi:hypothetical protein